MKKFCCMLVLIAVFLFPTALADDIDWDFTPQQFIDWIDENDLLPAFSATVLQDVELDGERVDLIVAYYDQQLYLINATYERGYIDMIIDCQAEYGKPIDISEESDSGLMTALASIIQHESPAKMWMLDESNVLMGDNGNAGAFKLYIHRETDKNAERLLLEPIEKHLCEEGFIRLSLMKLVQSYYSDNLVNLSSMAYFCLFDQITWDTTFEEAAAFIGEGYRTRTATDAAGTFEVVYGDNITAGGKLYERINFGFFNGNLCVVSCYTDLDPEYDTPRNTGEIPEDDVGLLFSMTVGIAGEGMDGYFRDYDEFNVSYDAMTAYHDAENTQPFLQRELYCNNEVRESMFQSNNHLPGKLGVRLKNQLGK